MNNDNSVLVIEQGVFDKLPNLVLISGLVEVGLLSEQNIAAIQSYLYESWLKLSKQVVDSSSEESARINQWSEPLKEAGIHPKKFPPSIQAIAKRVAKGGDPFRINPIVDTYNAISMDLALPLGAYDQSGLEGNLRLRLSPGGENFVALGSPENDPTLPEEIVYSDQSNILTRMFLWRQSEKSKISNSTKRFVFVCELLDGMDPGLVEQATETISEKMKNLLAADISYLSVQASS